MSESRAFASLRIYAERRASAAVVRQAAFLRCGTRFRAATAFTRTGEPLNDQDRFLRAVPRRETVIATLRSAPEHPSALIAEWDIVVAGRRTDSAAGAVVAPYATEPARNGTIRRNRRRESPMNESFIPAPVWPSFSVTSLTSDFRPDSVSADQEVS